MQVSEPVGRPSSLRTLDTPREPLVNAIYHRDYQNSGNVQVRVFDDRLKLFLDPLDFVVVFHLEAEPPTHLPADFGTSALIVSDLHKPGNGEINAYETHGKLFAF
jgi:hypothetical protein